MKMIIMKAHDMPIFHSLKQTDFKIVDQSAAVLEPYFLSNEVNACVWRSYHLTVPVHRERGQIDIRNILNLGFPSAT